MFGRAIILLVLIALPLAAGKKPLNTAPLVRLQDKHVELSFFWLPTPMQKCTNWAWAVALEAMLRAQQVTIKQNAWVQKAHFGELCIDDAISLEALAKLVDGPYILDDGRHVRLQSRIISGAPSIPDDLIAPLALGRPVLMFWKSRPLVVRAVTYDEYIYPNGQRMFQIKQMTLVDPLLTGKDREVSFENGRDDPADLAGAFLVDVVTETRPNWLGTNQPW